MRSRIVELFVFGSPDLCRADRFSPQDLHVLRPVTWEQPRRWWLTHSMREHLLAATSYQYYLRCHPRRGIQHEHCLRLQWFEHQFALSIPQSFARKHQLLESQSRRTQLLPLQVLRQSCFVWLQPRVLLCHLHPSHPSWPFDVQVSLPPYQRLPIQVFSLQQQLLPLLSFFPFQVRQPER